MNINLNTVSLRHRINSGEMKVVYTSPSNITNAIVDISLFLDTSEGNGKPGSFNIALFHEKETVSRTTQLNMLAFQTEIYEPQIINGASKVIVGPNQKLVIMMNGTGSGNIKVTGIEENNPNVLGAGLLGSLRLYSELSMGELYRLETPLAVYSSGYIYITNTTTSSNRCQLWITDNSTLTKDNESEHLADKIFDGTLDALETRAIKVTIAPNERIYGKYDGKAYSVIFNGIEINGGK